jgi:hypothetical protein
MWIIGVLVIVVIGACVAAIFLGGGEQGPPFVAISKFGGRRYRDRYQDGLHKPPNENELL